MQTSRPHVCKAVGRVVPALAKAKTNPPAAFSGSHLGGGPQMGTFSKVPRMMKRALEWGWGHLSKTSLDGTTSPPLLLSPFSA